MKIHRIEDEFCIRTVAFQQGNVVRGHVVPADHYETEICPAFSEKIMQGIEPGIVKNFYASLL